MFITAIKDFLLLYQQQLCQQISIIDGTKTFQQDKWQRESGDGGISCVLENGQVIEKGGVNFSHIQGDQLPASALKLQPNWQDSRFEVLGVSIVMHPLNPYAPTSHCNVRYFEVTHKNGESDFWFGGGFDLTPFYGFNEDCVLWHQHAKNACESFGADVYPDFKQQCDDYFYLPHRLEARGIGGIFYDHLHAWGKDAGFRFMQQVAMHYQQAYLTLLKRRKDTAYGQRERDFQLYRRGRYTEFNLLYDRGTLFGLQSKGRTESILMSLPPLSTYRYAYQPAIDSPEAKLYSDFLPIKDWLNTGKDN